MDFKQKKVTISDYSFVDNSIEISNISFTQKEFIDTCKSIELIIQDVSKINYSILV